MERHEGWIILALIAMLVFIIYFSKKKSRREDKKTDGEVEIVFLSEEVDFSAAGFAQNSRTLQAGVVAKPITSDQYGVECLYCQSDLLATGGEIQDLIVVCPNCSTPHHESCWKENKGCSFPYCDYQNSFK